MIAANLPVDLQIPLAGVLLALGTWLLLGRLWITIPGAALVLLWWWL